MAQQALPPLAHVNVLTSSVIPAPVAEVGLHLCTAVIEVWQQRNGQ